MTGTEVKPGATASVGFTLLEVAVASLVVTLVLGAIMSTTLQSEVVFAAQMKQLDLDQTGRRITSRLTDEIRAVDPDTILPLVLEDSPSIQFQKVVGPDQLGPVTTIGIQPAPGETVNGSDDNHDGRIDEGFITVSEQGGESVPFGGNVLGVRFSSIEGGVSFQIDIGLLDRDGNVMEKTFSRSVAFRN